MGGKRKKSDSETGEGEESTARAIDYDKETKKKKEILPSTIKNKDKRSEVHAKLKHQKKLEKRKKLKARDAAIKRALELGEEVRQFCIYVYICICIYMGCWGYLFLVFV